MADGRRTELIAGPEGPRLAKVATDASGHLLIAEEAARLVRARHPGVVELVHHDSERIETAWAGDRTLELASLDLGPATALLAAVTATVADLHDLGVVHGRLDPTHVIVGPDGSPRLCGMSGPRPGEPEPSAADDVAALGRLIHRVVGHGITAEPIPERRWRRRRWTGYQQRALQNLADQAQADEMERRPSARTLATSIAQVAPAARLFRPGAASDGAVQISVAGERGHDPAVPDVDDDVILVERDPEEAEPEAPAALPGSIATAEPRLSSGHTTDRPRLNAYSRGALVACSVLFALALIGTVRHGPSSTDAAVAPLSPDMTDTHLGAVPEDPDPTTTTEIIESTTSSPTGCTPVMGVSAQIDADGCPDPVSIDGTTITAGGVVFRAGEADDHVSVGDWTCSGAVTPGIVRPSTGEVFLFQRWPTDDEPLEVEAAAIVPGGQRLVVDDSGCGPPAVESAEGALTQLADPEDR